MQAIATVRVEERQTCIDTDANGNDPGIGLVSVRPLIPNDIKLAIQYATW